MSELCCHGKSSSYIPTSLVIGSFQLWVNITKILMLFDLAFQMKCKYINVIHHLTLHILRHRNERNCSKWDITLFNYKSWNSSKFCSIAQISLIQEVPKTYRRSSVEVGKGWGWGSQLFMTGELQTCRLLSETVLSLLRAVYIYIS